MEDLDASDLDVFIEDIKPEPGKWLLKLWLKPAFVFREIIAAEGKTWWVPLLILSVFQLVKSLAEIPARKAASMMASPAIPEGMQYISPEQQTQIDQGMTFQSGLFFTFFLPFILGLVGIWVIWLILSSLLHLSLTLSGGHSNSRATFNITAWSSLPLVFRMVIQTMSSLTTKMLIINSGLSGFISVQGRATMTGSLLLGLIDLFFLWQVTYLMIGTSQHSNVSGRKAILTVLIAVVFTMLLSIIPGFISYTISGMNITRPFFF
jgi:hypothetical protein